MDKNIEEAIKFEMKLAKKLENLKSTKLLTLLQQHKLEEEECRGEIRKTELEYEKAKGRMYRLFTAKQQQKMLLEIVCLKMTRAKQM